MSLFTLIYTMVAALFYLVALPFLFFFTLKTKYRQSIPARFFLSKNPPLKSDGIWIHSCSYGEAKAIKPLIDKIPPELLRLTTTTQTGYGEICSHTSQSRYLPFELLLFGWIQPQRLLMVMEAELWYLLFFIAGKRGTRRVLINARMSDRSYPKYMRLRWFYEKVFAQIDIIYTQTHEDRIKLESLGATNITVTGNIKFANISKPKEILDKPNGLIVVAASTHEGEEQLVLEAFFALKKDQPEAKLLIAPRHPERFKKVFKLIEQSVGTKSLTFHSYSQQSNFESDIVLVDMLGKLIDIYAISDIVVLGGAFEPIGGHNASEAAQFGCKIISGEHYFNQKEIFGGIEGIEICKNEELSKILLEHHKLPHTQIKNDTDITALLREIDQVTTL